MSEEKSVLRERLKAARQRFPRREAARLSGIIVNRVMDNIDWDGVETVHIYSPLGEQREVDARLLLEKIWQMYPAVRTARGANPDRLGSARAAAHRLRTISNMT